MNCENKYTVAICTYNRANLLLRSIQSVLNQKTDFSYNVIVVDNNSNDNTKCLIFELINNHHNISYYLESKRGVSAARNKALSVCETEYLIFLDDDAWADLFWLKNLVSKISESPNLDLYKFIVGPVKLIWEGSGKPNWFPSKYDSLLCEYNFGSESFFLGPDAYLLTTNVLFHVSTLKMLGGFRKDLGRIGNISLGGEDNEIFNKIYSNGFKVWYQSDSLVYHPVPIQRQSKKYLQNRLFWDGASQIILNNVSHLSLFDKFKILIFEIRKFLFNLPKLIIYYSDLDLKLFLNQKAGRIYMLWLIIFKKHRFNK